MILGYFFANIFTKARKLAVSPEIVYFILKSRNFHAKNLDFGLNFIIFFFDFFALKKSLISFQIGFKTFKLLQVKLP